MSSSERHVGTVLTGLLVVGGIKENEKVLVTPNKEFQVDNTEWFQCVRRYVGSQGRDKTMTNLTELFDDAFVMMQGWHAEDTPKAAGQLERIVAALRGSKNGLAGLHTTYVGDTNMQAKLTLLQQRVDDEIKLVTVPPAENAAPSPINIPQAMVGSMVSGSMAGGSAPGSLAGGSLAGGSAPGSLVNNSEYSSLSSTLGD